MAATFSGAVSEAAPAVVDTNETQGTGATSQGIGLTGVTGTSINGQRIGAASVTNDIEIYYPVE